MKVHCIQHVEYEGLGCIQDWISQNQHQVSFTKFHKNEKLPNVDGIDFLIIMGGPMGINDETIYPWLVEEKNFIRNAIEAQKIVLGICLGAQLIANALGSNVYPNVKKEIGWLPVNFNPGFCKYMDDGSIGDLHVFHWHGDTFDLPDGAILHSSSKACRNQLFAFNEKIMGIQFHLEATSESILSFVENGKAELVLGEEFIQSERQILSTVDYFERSNSIMFSILVKLTNESN